MTQSTECFRGSVVDGSSFAGGFEKEPNMALRFVDPVFEQACRSYFAYDIAYIVNGKHAEDECLVVVAQFAQHIERVYVLGVVVFNALQAGDMADGADGDAADLAHALGDVVGHGEDLVAVLVEGEMV